MYILQFSQEDTETNIAVFDTLEEGKSFVSNIPGYRIETEDGFTYESFMAGELPEYLEIAFNGHILPLSKFMFSDAGKVDIYWLELPSLSAKGHGMVNSATRIDAYIIANEDVKEYIDNRENKYRLVKAHLEEKGFDVDRNFHGSEDGEAIVYKKPGTEEWHFLTHLDPAFCDEEDVLKAVDDLLAH